MHAPQDAARLNTPDWLWDSWVGAYGEDLTRAIAAAHLADPPLDITLMPGEDAAGWAEKLDAIILATGSLRRNSGGRVEDLPGYGDGKWWVQDAAAVLPVQLLGEVAGMSVVDLCAAPGGKTAQLAAAGAKVVAVDRSVTRLKRLRENMKRLGLTADVIEADGKRWQPKTPVDVVLLDAPCSTTGTIRRHPDVAWLKSPDDVASLQAVQAAMLDNAPAMLKPGGTLIYCVCSLQPGEGEDQIDRFLVDHAAFTRQPVTDAEVVAEFITPTGDVRTLPCHLQRDGGVDGFFIARLTKAG
jgi:16S rRNA (cytosine967-C5)-methyltransferase